MKQFEWHPLVARKQHALHQRDDDATGYLGMMSDTSIAGMQKLAKERQVTGNCLTRRAARQVSMVKLMNVVVQSALRLGSIPPNMQLEARDMMSVKFSSRETIYNLAFMSSSGSWPSTCRRNMKGVGFTVRPTLLTNTCVTELTQGMLGLLHLQPLAQI